MPPATTQASARIGLPGSAGSSWHRETSGINQTSRHKGQNSMLSSATRFREFLRLGGHHLALVLVTGTQNHLPPLSSHLCGPPHFSGALPFLSSGSSLPPSCPLVPHGPPFTFHPFSALYLGPSTVGYQLHLPIINLLLPTCQSSTCSSPRH